MWGEEAFFYSIEANRKRPKHRLTAIPVRYAADSIVVGSQELGAAFSDRKIRK
jgi:hypothetical protein